MFSYVTELVEIQYEGIKTPNTQTTTLLEEIGK